MDSLSPSPSPWLSRRTFYTSVRIYKHFKEIDFRRVKPFKYNAGQNTSSFSTSSEPNERNALKALKLCALMTNDGDQFLFVCFNLEYCHRIIYFHGSDVAFAISRSVNERSVGRVLPFGRIEMALWIISSHLHMLCFVSSRWKMTSISRGKYPVTAGSQYYHRRLRDLVNLSIQAWQELAW